MKFRTDYVTNSSSASYIICFARIEDEEKAKKVIDRYGISMLDAKGVNNKKNWCGELGASWCGAIIYGVDDILSKYPYSNFIVITDYNGADYDDNGDPVYNYDFTMSAVINKITEENGFADIDIAEGEGRDG